MVGIPVALHGHVHPLCTSTASATEKLPGGFRASASPARRRTGKSVGCWCCHNRPRLPRPFTSKTPTDLTLIRGICLSNPCVRPAQRLGGAAAEPGAAQAAGPGGSKPARDLPQAPPSTEQGPEPQKQNFSPLSPCGWDGRCEEVGKGDWWVQMVPEGGREGGRGSPRTLLAAEAAQKSWTQAGSRHPACQESLGPSARLQSFGQEAGINRRSWWRDRAQDSLTGLGCSSGPNPAAPALPAPSNNSLVSKPR